MKYQAKWSKGGAVLPKLPQPNVSAQGSSRLSRGPPLPSLPKPVTNTASTRGASTAQNSATMSKRASDVEQLGGGHDLDPDDFKNFLEQQSGLKGTGTNSKPVSPIKNVSSLNPRP